MPSQTRFIKIPKPSPSPAVIAHVVEITGPGRIVYIAGQLGVTPDGKIAGNFRAQAVQAFENLKAALAAVGASFDDVVKLNNYLVDITRTCRPIARRATSMSTPSSRPRAPPWVCRRWRATVRFTRSKRS